MYACKIIHGCAMIPKPSGGTTASVDRAVQGGRKRWEGINGV